MDSSGFVSDMKQKLLKDYEHPFKWDPRKTMKVIPTVDEIIVRVTDQLCIVAIDGDLQCEYLMYYVGQSYAYANADKFQEALDSLERGEDKLNELTDYSLDDTMYGRAFLHLIRTMRAFLLILTGDIEAAAQILPIIPSISEMDSENQAAMEGLRGIFYGEYGFEGFKLAIEFLSKAIEINANESVWHFLKGKYLSRLRHAERSQDIPNAEEMYHLEQASKLKKNGTYSLFLAQMYQEMARCYYQKLMRNKSKLPPEEFTREKNKSSNLNEKASKLYKESLTLKPDCPQMLFRCAKGFMRLPNPFRQEKLAKELLEKGLKLIPDSGFGNHAMAQYYERLENDPQKAMEHLKICEKERIFPAVMDLVRLEFQIGGATNTVQRLEALLESYKEIVQKSQILVLLSSHHLFTLNDLRKACQYADEVKRLNGSYDYLKKQYQPFLTRGTMQHYSRMVELLDVLMDEIKIAVQEPTCSVEDKEYFETFFRGVSLSAGHSTSITEAPQYLKRKIIADAEQPSAPPANRNRNHDFKFRLPTGTQDERKTRSTFSSRKTTGWSSRDKENSVCKAKDETGHGDSENCTAGEAGVVGSMRNMKVRDPQPSTDKNAPSRPQKDLDSLMMAVLDKY